jgi:acyl-CoA thioesterase I
MHKRHVDVALLSQYKNWTQLGVKFKAKLCLALFFSIKIMQKLLFLFLILLTACGADLPKQSALPAGSKVLILGDSLSYGTGAKQGEDYPTLLAQSTGWDIINAGIPGDTTAGGLTRIESLIQEHQPNLLIVELGGNDFLQRMPAKTTEANLKAILAKAKVSNTKTLLLAIPEFSPLMAAVGNLSDHPMYIRIAEETETPVASEVFSGVLSDRTLKADQVHPNSQGYAQVAVKLQSALKELGYLR